MKSWINRENFHSSAIKKILADAIAKVPQIDLKLTEDLATWLGQLSLLYGVPIEYMVPDFRMLPNEAIRFFYLDRNWLDRLIDGALSVGVLSTKENIFKAAFFDKIYEQIDIAQQNIRGVVREESSVFDSVATGGTISGILMRSQVVSDYPGLEIKPYDNQGIALKIVRMDRLPGSMIICMFDGVPDKIDFIQPSEGLHFGVFAGDNIENSAFINLRGLGYNGHEGGKQLGPPTDPLTAKVPFVAGSDGVLDIDNLVKNVKKQMKTLTDNPLNNPKILTSGGFAIQMVVTAGRQSYDTTVKDEHGNTCVPPACGPQPTNKSTN